jgi:hypothetical protein
MSYVKKAAQISLFSLALIEPLSALAANEAPPVRPPTELQGQTKTPPPPQGTPTYRPPVRGNPGGRVGGGTRGLDLTFTLSVLAPNHTGLTVREQPVLYWYVSKQISGRLEFTLTDDGVKPLIEAPLSPPFPQGIQRIPLADFGVKLAPGKQYKWFVALIVEPERRSRDVLAGGTIERVEPSEGLAAKLAEAEKSQFPHIYANAGLWYDAIEAISELIDATPHDSVLRMQRASLLQQAGLTSIAQYDLASQRD